MSRGRTYTGNDSISIELNLRVFTSRNLIKSEELLTSFENTKKENLADIFFVDGKVEKFYLHDLDIDIKEAVDEKFVKYLNDYQNEQEDFHDVELEITYNVRGYYDPGYISGPPENCYPPESDEERTIEYADIIINKNKSNKLEKNIYLNIPSKYLDVIYNIFEEQIEEKEFSNEGL